MDDLRDFNFWLRMKQLAGQGDLSDSDVVGLGGGHGGEDTGNVGDTYPAKEEVKKTAHRGGKRFEQEWERTPEGTLRAVTTKTWDE